MKYNFITKEFQYAAHLRTPEAFVCVLVGGGDAPLAEQEGLRVASPDTFPLESCSSHRARSPFKYFLCSFWKWSASERREGLTWCMSRCAVIRTLGSVVLRGYEKYAESLYCGVSLHHLLNLPLFINVMIFITGENILHRCYNKVNSSSPYWSIFSLSITIWI